MAIAALICFAILLIAWVVAPDGHTKDARVAEPEAVPATA
jgi:hypothetical protein